MNKKTRELFALAREGSLKTGRRCKCQNCNRPIMPDDLEIGNP